MHSYGHGVLPLYGIPNSGYISPQATGTPQSSSRISLDLAGHGDFRVASPMRSQVTCSFVFRVHQESLPSCELA